MITLRTIKIQIYEHISYITKYIFVYTLTFNFFFFFKFIWKLTNRLINHLEITTDDNDWADDNDKVIKANDKW